MIPFIIFTYLICPQDSVEIYSTYYKTTTDTIIIVDDEHHYLILEPCGQNVIPDEIYYERPFRVHSTTYPSFVRIYNQQRLVAYYEQWDARTFYISSNIITHSLKVIITSNTYHEKEIPVKNYIKHNHIPPFE